MEDALSLALLALVVGTRPVISPAMMLAYLRDHFDITDDWVSVWWTRPDDFIVHFSNQEDLDLVLRTPSPPGAPFVLRWRRWSRLILGSAGAFRYRVLVGMKSTPSHARSAATAQAILGSSGAKVDIANPDALAELFMAVWCAHHDLGAG